MTPQKKLSLSPNQQAHLVAWSVVYVEAHIQQRLGVSLSHFLRHPGKYLFIAWLETSQPVTSNGYLPLLPAQVATSERIHPRWKEQDV